MVAGQRPGMGNRRVGRTPAPVQTGGRSYRPPVGRRPSATRRNRRSASPVAVPAKCSAVSRAGTPWGGNPNTQGYEALLDEARSCPNEGWLQDRVGRALTSGQGAMPPGPLESREAKPDSGASRQQSHALSALDPRARSCAIEPNFVPAANLRQCPQDNLSEKTDDLHDNECTLSPVRC